MQPLDDETRQWTLKWLRKADKDLRLAQDIAHDPYHFDSLAYHCHQAAEKYVKAALTAHGIRFAFTHNLRVLLEQLETSQPVGDEWYAAASQLNPFSTLTRYPLEDETEPPAQLLLALAQNWCTWRRPSLAEATQAGPYPTQ